MTIEELLQENDKRNEEINKTFDPVSGEGSILERVEFSLDDFSRWYIPLSMANNALVKELMKFGSIQEFLHNRHEEDPDTYGEEMDYEAEKATVIDLLIRVRCDHDFAFWAVLFVFIKNKSGGEDIRFRLNRPQRKLIEQLERMRLADKPIRLILLKARQWGGSTAVQIYMAWIQLRLIKGWNSIVVSHVMTSTTEVKGMFTKLIETYPVEMLHEPGEPFSEKEQKLRPFEGSQNIDFIPQRNCKIKTGTAVSPESARGGDSAMAHCTEVAFWNKTDNKTPEQIIRSACSGILYQPLTMVVYESTANGTGNFFHEEWCRAKRGESDKYPLFVAWFDIPMYSLDIKDKELFAKQLIENRNSEVNNSEGRYNWTLWNKGATLEAINWYIHKRKEFKDHSDMAAEYPSDDVEAFKHSGQKVFDNYKVEELRNGCTEPKYIGEVRGEASEGKAALRSVHFNESNTGLLKVWSEPDKSINVSNRYVVVVDVGGRSKGADYSDIYVLDRIWLMDGEGEETVAEWHGHIRHDLLAWKAAQIATYYNNALLVIESNTIETKDNDTDGDHTEYILNQIADTYSNLYARKQSEESIRQGLPVKWGFHTNRSTKVAVIDNLVKVIEELGYIERDSLTIDEYLTYEKKQNGSFGAIDGKHDDKLMTRGIGLYISRCELQIPKMIEDRPKHKQGRTITAATL
ncbi:MAG: terminase [Tannerellaceae bacterium]